MKFKVGDRVEHSDYGKGTIVETDSGSSKDLILVQFDNPGQELHNGNGESKREYKGEKCWYFDKSTNRLIKILDTQFTKSDLQNGDIVTYRDGQTRTVMCNKLMNEDGTATNYLTMYKDVLTYKDSQKDIVKVERPIKYETVFERKEEILNEVEKNYLANVIKPFRDKVVSIKKIVSDKTHITIYMKRNDYLSFPYLEDDTMYKGMKPNKEYTLEELGL